MANTLIARSCKPAKVNLYVSVATETIGNYLTLVKWDRMESCNLVRQHCFKCRLHWRQAITWSDASSFSACPSGMYFSVKCQGKSTICWLREIIWTAVFKISTILSKPQCIETTVLFYLEYWEPHRQSCINQTVQCIHENSSLDFYIPT